MAEANTEIIHKEIDLIQNCINRMAQNSFLLKGWTVSLLAVVIAVARDLDFMYLCLLLMLPLMFFWYLDAVILRMEKMYRQMYNWVIRNRGSTNEYLYDLDPNRFRTDVPGESRIMVSKSLLVFYGIPGACLILGFLWSIGA